MALKVYTSGNYIITDTGYVMHEFAKGYTTYSYNQSTQTFTIRESVGGSFTVTRAQVLAGDITDESSVAYTFSTFEAFLRENTGFKTASGGSEAYSTTVVNISSAQILAMGTTPIELLPAAGAGKYYEIEKVRFEYTHNTTNYTITDDTPGIIITDSLGYASKAIDQYFFGYENTYIVWDGEFETFNNQIPNTAGISMSMRPLNSDLILSLPAGATIADGDGTLQVIITYTTRTFGL